MGRRILLGIVGLWMVFVMAGVGYGKGEDKVFLRLDPGGHVAMIKDLFLLEGGRKLLSASNDKTIRLWDLSDLSRPLPLSSIRGEIGLGLFGKVYAIAPSPDGRLLAVGGVLQVKVLTDPGKGEIISALKGLGEEMYPEDRFIFFAATHGFVTDDRYWLVTSNYDGVLSSKNSITSEELMELSKGLPALRQVLVVDTCHAGALDYAFSGIYENRFTSLALDMGMHVLSAAKSYQEAIEDFEKWGHGLFTYYVLKALGGEADTNGDRQVTVIELGPYVKANVEKDSSGFQKPIITNFGEDVVMSKVK